MHHGGHGSRVHGVNLPGSRARRGDLRVAVVALLREQDMHGYQIIQEISERSGGAWNPSPGAVYPALQGLEDQGMVLSQEVGGKRVFSLTELGRKHADMIPAEGPWAEMAERPDPSAKLREAFGGLLSATSQVGRSGTPEQVDEAARILNAARKQIYTMLAGE